ncbi:hypothetical protein Bbelb_036270 [Branchiostoma belcheri]|nr:hypothetical protein Bbelb_036270 [Branchiostoma belcheri]
MEYRGQEGIPEGRGGSLSGHSEKGALVQGGAEPAFFSHLSAPPPDYDYTVLQPQHDLSQPLYNMPFDVNKSTGKWKHGENSDNYKQIMEKLATPEMNIKHRGSAVR